MVRQVRHDRYKDAFSIIAGPELITWLNDKSNVDERERSRVRDFLRLVQRAQQVSEEVFPKPIEEDLRDRRPFYLQAEINSQLKRYPLLYHFRFYPPQVRTDLELLKGSPQRYKEFRYINAILKLAERRRVTDVCQCNCGKWFLARTSLTRFCSAACRINFWEKSDERRERKREKAREYYLLHKTGIVKSGKKRAVSK
jgi:hypothetical protein